MLDLKYVEKHFEEIQKNIQNRNLTLNIAQLEQLLQERKNFLKKIEEVQQKSNENAKDLVLKTKEGQKKLIEILKERGKNLKQKVQQLKDQWTHVEQNLNNLLFQLPNKAHPKAPVGKTEADNVCLYEYKSPKTYNFIPKDHLYLCHKWDLIDFSRASQVTGPKFYYLKNHLVLLELALERYALDFLCKKSFIPLKTPDLAHLSIIEKLGFSPRGEESNIYTLKDEHLGLIGTSEITLGGYLANQTFNLERPLKLAGLSHCFRKEAGAAGQDSKGLFRVHQFSKVEMFVACQPEESDALHKELLSIEEEFYQSLGVSYRVLDICTGDLGNQAARKFDIEAWFPGRLGGSFGEITSASNCLDYQARRLKIKYQTGQDSQLAYLLNGTCVATTRVLMLLLETYQNADESIDLPPVLFPYLTFQKIE